MQTTSRALGLLLTVLLATAPGAVTGAAAAPASDPAPRVGYRCLAEPFGQTAAGRIVHRRTVNGRVELTRTTRERFDWHPISWALVRLSGGPDHETARHLVASTDGVVRRVETHWDARGGLDVRVLGIAGRGYPGRLAAVGAGSIYWVGEDHALHRKAWNGRRFANETVLPVTVVGARTLTAYMTDYGMRLFYTDRDGALHLVADEGARSTDTVLRTTGYADVTGLRAGACMSPNYANVRPFVTLLSVDRATGVARWQRVLGVSTGDAPSLTERRRVGRPDWTWRRLG